jgi:hypothetical protein
VDAPRFTYRPSFNQGLHIGGTRLQVRHDHRDDRRLRLVSAELETELAEARMEALRILPEVRTLVPRCPSACEWRWLRSRTTDGGREAVKT